MASCLFTREGFHHPTIGHQVGHKAWQRLRRNWASFCVRINPIQDHHLIPQLGIKHMHGAVHISLREGKFASQWFVCFIPQLGIKGVAQGLLSGCFFAICPKAHTWNGDGRLQRSHLGEMLVSASTCVLALQDYNTAAAHHCSGLEWEGPGGTYLPRFGWTFEWPHPPPVSATPPTQRHSSTSSRGADRGLCPHPYLPRGSALACQVRRGVGRPRSAGLYGPTAPRGSSSQHALCRGCDATRWIPGSELCPPSGAMQCQLLPPPSKCPPHAILLQAPAASRCRVATLAFQLQLH